MRGRGTQRPGLGAKKGARGGNLVSPHEASEPAPAGSRRETERAGFEPATHLAARTRFPVALLRPLGHLSETGQRIDLAAGRQVVEVVIDALHGSCADVFPVELDLDLDACRRADGKEPVSLLDGVPGFFQRPQIVVHDAVPVRGVPDRADMPIGTTDDADDPVLGDACSLAGFRLAASLSRSELARQ